MPLTQGLQQQLSDIRRHIHRHPELSGEEVATTSYIRELLAAADIRILDFPELSTGVIAEIGTGDTVIALRADIDSPPVLNHSDWTDAAIQAAKQSGLETVIPAVSPASEDFAFYQKEVPGVFIFVGTSGPQEWHHPSFDVDERALSGTATFLANTARQALIQVEQ